MANTDRVKQVKDAIIEHLRTIGARDWEDVKKDFPDISAASFWRYVKQAKEHLNKKSAPASPDLFNSEKASAASLEPWEKPELNSTFRMLKHAERFYELHTDVLALRQQALIGEGPIRDTRLFARTIRLRQQLLCDEMNVVDRVHNTDVKTKFLDEIVEEVSKASPEVAKTIMVSLHNLNEKNQRDAVIE
jgi:hypothetical protein